MRKPSKGNNARRPDASRAQLIQDFLRDGLTVTVGGVPIQITLGEAQPAVTRPATKAAAPPPKPRKARRRKSRRPIAPDPRDIRGYLATRMEGATLTALAAHFKIKRPVMKRLLKRMLDKQDVTLFKGAFFNNKRLRQRRITSKYTEALSQAAPPPTDVVEQVPASLAAVPDSEKEEPISPDAIPHPESDAA